MLPHQEEIVDRLYDSVADESRLFVYGGKGTFKTSTIVLAFWTVLRFLSCYYGGLRYVVGAMTHSQLREAFLEQWEEQVPERDYIYNSQKGTIYLVNSDTQIWLRHTSASMGGIAANKAAKTRRGGNICGYYFPQAESMSEAFYTEIESRTRRAPYKLNDPHTGTLYEDYPPYKLRLLDANPDSPFHFLYELFLNAGSETYIGDESEVMRLKTTPENSAYSEKEIAHFRRTWEKHEVARMLDAEWVGASGLVYSKFDRELHVYPVKPKDSWEYYFAIDFGWNAPFCCLLIALDSDGNSFIVDEIYKRKTDLDVLASEMLRKWGDYDIKAAIVDSEEPRAYRALQKYYRDNGSRLRIQLADKGIEDGLRACQRRISLGEDGRVRFQVDPSCVNFLREISLLEWEVELEGRRIKEKPQESASDHALDAWRYCELYISGILERRNIKL